MTSRHNPRELDATSLILHASQLGVSLEEYMDSVRVNARKKVRNIMKDLREEE
jgi:hypothetical protein